MTPSRSRTAWPERKIPTTKPGVHDHHYRLPKAARLILTGLVVIAVALTAAVAALAFYTYQLSKYAEGEGEQAERARARLACELMDQLPEGGPLVRPRQKYGCGPGIPLSDLPPEEEARIRQQRAPVAPQPGPQPGQPPEAQRTPSPTPTPSPPPPTAPRVGIGPAPQPAPRLAPQQAPSPEPEPVPEPMPDPVPAPDSDPLTGLICDATGVCVDPLL